MMLPSGGEPVDVIAERTVRMLADVVSCRQPARGHHVVTAERGQAGPQRLLEDN